MEISPFKLVLLTLSMFIFGGITGIEMSKAYNTLDENVCAMPYVITEDAKVFVLNNDKTIVVFQGQPYHFNESNHKTTKAKLNERTSK